MIMQVTDHRSTLSLLLFIIIYYLEYIRTVDTNPNKDHTFAKFHLRDVRESAFEWAK